MNVSFNYVISVFQCKLLSNNIVIKTSIKVHISGLFWNSISDKYIFFPQVQISLEFLSFYWHPMTVSGSRKSLEFLVLKFSMY